MELYIIIYILGLILFLLNGAYRYGRAKEASRRNMENHWFAILIYLIFWPIFIPLFIVLFRILVPLLKFLYNLGVKHGEEKDEK
jgi:ABC-type Fe3+ transport system permease subunit